MLSLFKTEPSAEPFAAGPEIHFEDAAPTEPAEFEIVLGRRQLASVLFVATVVIAVFSSISYLAGKSLAPAPQKIEVIRTVPVLESAPATAVKPEPPLFAEPRQGPLYLQMGAVEKGIAVIFAEGLRKHGFDAFVAPGPNDHIFRVLIGPLADEQAYAKARDAAGAIGLNVFGERFNSKN
jgi:cell division septation protein DedD